MRGRVLLSLAAALGLGCQAVTTPATTARRPPVARATAAPGPEASSAVRYLPPAPARTLASADLAGTATLIGKVKLISDKGGGILSNNSGNLISDKGGGLVSNNGGGLVSNNGGGIVSSGGGSYRTLGDAAPQEALLAEARIEVLDAEGRRLIGPDGKPIEAISDAAGQYRLEAALPKENLVLHVRLFNGGELFCMAAVAGVERGAPLALDIDTASSLGGAYVLDRYVQGSREIYDRLPQAEALALRSAVEAARAGLAGFDGRYTREGQAAAVEALRQAVGAVDTKLEQIKQLLLIGQKDLGNGLPANQVPMVSPFGLTLDAAGNLIVAESLVGRLRKIDPQGRVAGVLTNRTFALIQDVIALPDGGYLVADTGTNRVFKVGADGTTLPFAGLGPKGKGGLDGPAVEAGLDNPSSIARSADGTVWIAEKDRLLAVDTAGLIHRRPLPSTADAYFESVAVAPDGAVWVIDTRKEGALWRQPPGGAWMKVAQGLACQGNARLAFKPDGTALVSQDKGHRITAVALDGTLTPVAGTGAPGYQGDGGPATAAQLASPSGLFWGPDGRLYVADTGNAMVRAIGPDGVIRTVAGTQGLTQQGNIKALAVNGPMGLAVDSQGRVIVAEGGTGQIKRLEGDSLSVIAGSTLGYSGDGGPAIAAQLDRPVGVAYAGETMFVLCTERPRLRRVDPLGIITTLLACEPNPTPFTDGLVVAASALSLASPFGVVADPQGRPVFSSGKDHAVMRLKSETEVELIAGRYGTQGDTGDAGAATNAKLGFPAGLAYDQAGNLYIAEGGNLIIRKVAPDGTTSTFAGQRPLVAGLKFLSYQPGSDENADAQNALFFGPASLAFDGEGNLFVGEVGTDRLSSVADVGGLPISPSMLPQVKARIRKITPAGKVTTVAGPGGKVFNGTGDAAIGMPIGLVFDGQGRLVIADGVSNQIKIVPKEAL